MRQWRIGEELAKVGSKEGYEVILRRCAEIRSLSEGKLVHRKLLSDPRCSGNVLLRNLLIRMYGKCGSVADARAAFESIHTKNTYSWSIMVAAYAQNGHFREALDLYEEMEHDRHCVPEHFVYSTVLGACSDLTLGKKIHSRILQRRMELNTVVETALLKMYASCGCIDEAEKVFTSTSRKDVISWNAMIAAYARNGHLQAFRLYREMLLDGSVIPNYSTFSTILNICCSVSEGMGIHLLTGSLGLDTNPVVQISLLNMYSRCGRSDRACWVFDRIENGSLVAWNAMIAAYAQSGHYTGAWELYKKMEHQPDEFTFASILGACEDLEKGRAVHSRIISMELCSVIVHTALVSMYLKLGSSRDAESVFQEMPERDLVAWNTIVAGLVQCGDAEEAIGFYRRMDVKPSTVTFASVLAACSSLGDLTRGKAVHEDAVTHNMDNHLLVQSALVNMYAKCGSVKEAKTVFDKMQRRDIVSWNAMIAAYAQGGHCKKALELYQRLEWEGVEPDVFTFANVLTVCAGLGDFENGRVVHERMALSVSQVDVDVFAQNALLIMYSRCGSLEETKALFEKVLMRNAVSWNAMIQAYARHGHNREAVECYHEMDTDPDEITYVTVLNAVSVLADNEEGNAIHERMRGSAFERVPVVQSALMNMHAKCGKMHIARRLFEEMEEKEDAVWNVMLMGYADYGETHRALGLYYEMELGGIAINGVTLCGILVSCTHEGLVEKGGLVFKWLSVDHGFCLGNEHYRSMVDLLGRSGRLQDALDLVDGMPLEPDPTVWMRLGAACKLHGEFVLADRICEWLDPEDAASYVLLSNIFSPGESICSV